MRTIYECKAVVSAAETAGLIWYIVDQEKHSIKVASFHGERTFSGHYFWQDAADYVLSLYPKEATPEPMTCRCKRMEWDAHHEIWGDHKQHHLFISITCPDCDTKCLPKGAISYKDGLFGMLSTPFRKGDLLEVLKNPKEETVKIKLSEAVSSIMGDTSGISGVWIIVWGENHVGLQEVVNAFRKHQALSTYQRRVSHFSSMPVESERSAADIIIHVTGGPTGMTLEITKNRHGKMRRFDCMADCYFKESNMNQNDVEKAWPYKHLHCDSAGYADCFRILRDAKKDGVIQSWWYDIQGIRGCPTAAVMLKGNTKPSRHDDKDGTKGDIGILREAADYVLGLRKKAEKPNPKTMSALDCRIEINSSGMKLDTNDDFLLPMLKEGPIGRLSMFNTETFEDFLRRCVVYIRGMKQ